MVRAAAAGKGEAMVNVRGRNLFNGFFRAAIFRAWRPKIAFSGAESGRK